MKKVLLFVVALATISSAADSLYTGVASYMNSGWGKAYVLSNGLCSLAVIPGIGARIARYGLGMQNFISIDPSINKSDPNWFGGAGFMAWPAPQDTFGWEPTPLVSSGTYTPTVLINTPDSVVLSLDSKPEITANKNADKAKDLMMRKIYTFYKGSSRVRVDIRLINKGTQTKTGVSIREVCPVLAQHNNGADYSNFRAYFPKGTSSQDQALGGYWNTMGTADPSQFTLDNSAGVIDLKYANGGQGARIAAHPKSQWLAYQDSSEGFTFIQKGVYDSTHSYIEYGGAVIIMYLSSWIETELCSYGKDIAPNDSIQIISNWYATKLAGRVRSVNNAGAIHDSLAVSVSSGNLKGTYGVYYKGTVKVCFNGQAAPADSIAVTPLSTFALDKTVTIPASAGAVSLLLYNSDGVFVDTLDAKNFRTVGTMYREATQAPKNFSIIVKNHKITVAVPENANAKVLLTSLSGKTVFVSGLTSYNSNPIDVSGLVPGSYLVTVETAHQRYTRMVPLFTR